MRGDNKLVKRTKARKIRGTKGEARRNWLSDFEQRQDARPVVKLEQDFSRPSRAA
jgi:hypothetical protein